jgi:hypothetical protein
MQIHLLYLKITSATNINSDVGIFKCMTASKCLLTAAPASMSGNGLHMKCTKTTAYCVILIHFRRASSILFVYLLNERSCRSFSGTLLNSAIDFSLRVPQKSMRIANLNLNFSCSLLSLQDPRLFSYENA